MGMFKKLGKAVGKVAGKVPGGVGAKAAKTPTPTYEAIRNISHQVAQDAQQRKNSPKSGGQKGVLPKGIKETKVGKINPNLVGKPKPGVAPTSGSRMGGNQSLPPPKVGGKRSLPPMPTKVPATGKPRVAPTSGVRTGPMRPGVAPGTGKGKPKMMDW